MKQYKVFFHSSGSQGDNKALIEGILNRYSRDGFYLLKVSMISDLTTMFILEKEINLEIKKVEG